MSAAHSGRRRIRRPPLSHAAALACAWGLLYTNVLSAADGATNPPKALSHQVVIDGVKYEPEALTIKRGDTVVWVNKDPFPHTVTAAGVFDSHSIAVGASWKYVARERGEYTYTCTLHPNMKGTLKIE